MRLGCWFRVEEEVWVSWLGILGEVGILEILAEAEKLDRDCLYCLICHEGPSQEQAGRLA